MDSVATYRNPIFDRDFPDPFVLKYCGHYWAYSTGIWPDGRAFGILHSRDLVNWQAVGGAMALLPGNHPCYWAPEVTYDNGRFYLYYSVGDETNMHLRVATAEHPVGPFIDQGVRLTQEPFAIDPHLFWDEDGRRYLFYATDFLAHERIGTGTVVDQMLDPFTLAGQPRPVTRARYEWQIYDPQRVEKGGVRWHTLEGPFVLKRKGIYYQMFSGGNWQNPSYGVAYATSDTLERAGEWQQVCDGERILPILRTVPGQVIGPGHNSVVRGPDNRQLYCVYHRWGRDSGRQLAIDPLDFAGKRMLILGPSHTQRNQPLRPTFADFFEDGRVAARWLVKGDWQVQAGAAVGVGNSGKTAVLTYDLQQLPFLAEVSVRAPAKGNGSYGLSLSDGRADLFRFCLTFEQPGMVAWQSATAWQEQILPLPPAFRFDAYHLLRLEVNGRVASLCLDNRTVWQGQLAQPPVQLSLFAGQTAAAFAGFALTVGWQDCFDGRTTVADLGWAGRGLPDWSIQEQQLLFANQDGESLLQKGPRLAAYELVINVRLHASQEDGGYGIAPALTADRAAPLFMIKAAGAGWAACWQDGRQEQNISLPTGFDPTVYQQFRFRKENGRLTIHWEQAEIASLPVTTEPTHIGLYGRCATVTFDMVRLTAITDDDTAITD